ncbi:MAG: hypothetical protein CM15mP129_02100 [Chloroflexota bacterium]|nr:MAG: hypothetical protein CM15mP129_02100 [Chloroflexota bacterium]
MQTQEEQLLPAVPISNILWKNSMGSYATNLMKKKDG